MTQRPSAEAIPLQGFAPVIDTATHTLILGSFPGEASLRAQQYYAFKQNQFWRLLSGVLDENLVDLSYPDRLQSLLAHGIGLWDVFGACRRQGSLDSAIRQGEPNNFRSLQLAYPQLRKLCFNGNTAGKMRTDFEQMAYTTLQLPSSSPAYAQMRFEDKLLRWKCIIENTAS
ncbi:DNA-deoxyinosine glycosylase [Undibacterium sp. Ren11W]|uniref:DNA-deoxyinosine glycosylase n=1 Tax=Undibacterium sp. Ren11W TaxID=3413045 RepID=UPI003BEF5604